ncbi:hypothetical protein EYV94_07575 [Puteibacter caeruleilacunae]|nr:hypothetical protein EYV94_07575 [Puteibacter caeruleilacunae]
MQGEFFTFGLFFLTFYHVTKLITTHLLKRRIIKSGHFEKAEILTPIGEEANQSQEVNKYPSLKWGLVAFFTGLGFVVIDILRVNFENLVTFRDAVLPAGIILMFTSLGFLIYFFIVTIKKQ